MSVYVPTKEELKEFGADSAGHFQTGNNHLSLMYSKDANQLIISNDVPQRGADGKIRHVNTMYMAFQNAPKNLYTSLAEYVKLSAW